MQCDRGLFHLTMAGCIRIPLYSKEASTLLRECVCSHAPLGVSLQPPGTEEQELGQPSHSPRPVKEATCLSCQVVFDSREDQVEHYKLDWHRYNIKRRLKGLEGIEQDQFEKIAGDVPCLVFTT